MADNLDQVIELNKIINKRNKQIKKKKKKKKNKKEKKKRINKSFVPLIDTFQLTESRYTM